MPWPPSAGEPLPNAANIWFEQGKLEWILGSEGHGHEWTRVFRVDSGDWERVWRAIAEAMPEATIKEVRQRSPHGVTCGVQVGLTIGDRSAQTLISWHYALEIAMIEVLEPELGPAARIVFAPLDKLRVVKPSSKSS